MFAAQNWELSTEVFPGLLSVTSLSQATRALSPPIRDQTGWCRPMSRGPSWAERKSGGGGGRSLVFGLRVDSTTATVAVRPYLHTRLSVTQCSGDTVILYQWTQTKTCQPRPSVDPMVKTQTRQIHSDQWSEGQQPPRGEGTLILVWWQLWPPVPTCRREVQEPLVATRRTGGWWTSSTPRLVKDTLFPENKWYDPLWPQSLTEFGVWLVCKTTKWF